MKRVAMVLSGCGFLDGTEITEAVSLMVELSRQGAEVLFFAPDQSSPVTNHLSQLSAQQMRSPLEESARISRSSITELGALVAKDFDALVLPGGFGAATVLSDWGSKGAACTVNADLTKVIQDFYRLQKPIGACCIAPVLLAKVLGSYNVQLTIGNDKETNQEILKTGALPVDCPVDDFVSDRDHRVITTPAYMYEAKPHEVFLGISKLVAELIEMA